MRFVTLSCILLIVALLHQLSSCQSNVSIETAQYAVHGHKLYRIHCQNCHGAKGEGLGKLYPPLTDNDFLVKNRALLSCIIKNGYDKTIEVAGQTYSQSMPGNPQLTDVDIAYILTYVTTVFGKSEQTYSHDEVRINLKECTAQPKNR